MSRDYNKKTKKKMKKEKRKREQGHNDPCFSLFCIFPRSHCTKQSRATEPPPVAPWFQRMSEFKNNFNCKLQRKTTWKPKPPPPTFPPLPYTPPPPCAPFPIRSSPLLIAPKYPPNPQPNHFSCQFF